MSRTDETSTATLPDTRLRLKIWHPDCWTLQVTESTEAGLIADGVYIVGSAVKAHVIAYADRRDQIDDLVEATRSSPLTESVGEIEKRYDFGASSTSPGNATRELIVTYHPTNSIHEALISRGFIPDELIRMRDGYEYWTVVVGGGRSNISPRLDQIRTQEDAEIEIQWMEQSDVLSGDGRRFNDLSERQREVFELAQRKGYYTWPREVSASELAEEIRLSQATVLEHLRKAEAKLLGDV